MQYLVELRLPAGHGTMTLLDSRWQKYNVIMQSRVTRHRARVLDLADKEPWWDKGGYPGL